MLETGTSYIIGATSTLPECNIVSNCDSTSIPCYCSMPSVSSSTATQLPTPATRNDCSQCKKTKRPVVSQCETCNQFLCQVHSGIHQDEYEGHQLVPIANEGQISICPMHEEEIKFYCRGCRVCLCASCGLIDHHHHDCISLAVAFTETVSSIGLQLLSLDASVSDLSSSVCRLSELGNDLSKKEMEIAQDINESFQTILMALDNRRNELISSLPSKRLQIEAHKHSIQSLLTRVTETTHECRHLFQSSDMIHVVSSKESMVRVLSSVDAEIKSIDWRDDVLDNHAEFNCDVDEMVQFIHHLGKLNVGNARMSKLRALACRTSNEMRDTLNALRRDMERHLASMKWVEAESRLTGVSSIYFSRLHALNLNGERFDDLLQPLELEWNNYFMKEQIELRQLWEAVVESEFDTVLSSCATDNLDVASPESFGKSIDRATEDMLNCFNRKTELYGTEDDYVRSIAVSRTGQGIEVMSSCNHSFEKISALVAEMRVDVMFTATYLMSNVSNMTWEEVESRLSLMINGCGYRLTHAIAASKLGNEWNGKLAKQFQPILDGWLVESIAELRRVLDGKISRINRADENELFCRRTIVAILKQARGDSNWNGPDDRGIAFNWHKDLNLREWNGYAFGHEKRIQVDENGMVKCLCLSRLGMRGVLPEATGNLTSLVVLVVSFNKLSVLPDTIGNLTCLTWIAADSNQLSTLPESIGNLRSLTKLYVANNQLSALPGYIATLSSLSELYVSKNPMTLTGEGRNEIRRMFSRPGLNLHVG